MFSRFINHELLRNPEFQSALVRLGIWLFSIVYIGLGAWTEYYDVNVVLFYLLFGGYFIFFVLTLISVYQHPVMVLRPYVTLFADVSATSLAIFLTQEAVSPFFLLYIWIFVSYGTRYGKSLLMAASILSLIAFNLVLIALQEWHTHTFEALFFMLLLVLLPIYQYSLLRKLHRARQEAEQANKARGDFLATMTHELRTPLIGILGMARLMQGTPLDAEQKEYLHSILSSAQLLRALIGDILDFSKIDANKLELVSEPFDIRQLVGNVNSSLAGEAQEKQLEIRCWVDPRIPRRLQGDNLRLSQILFNLLGNAIKFTDSGSVMLRVEYAPANEQLSEPHVLIQVSDTGIGIPKDKLKHIFDMFWQADASNSRRFGGTGLGTTVARDLCRRMGGDISVESRVDKGTIFSARLPLFMGQGAALPVISPLLEGKRILIYETDPQNMELHLKIAEELGMKPFPVLSMKALTPYLDHSFDVVLICDSLAGVGLNSIFSRLEILEGNPLVLLAGYRGRTIGVPSPVSRVLMKPFLADDLVEAVLDPLRELQSRRDALSSALGREVQESTGIQILLAEDNAIAAKVLSTLLIQRGHSVHITKDGEEALEAATQSNYHLAFIDLRMPRMDGIEFTRQFRRMEPADSHLPIYALTANTAEDAMEHCMQAGMDGFLNKPVEPEQLDVIIERYAGSRLYQAPMKEVR
ncbi:MAG: response regulator [Candidatus Thiodiazotropha sp. (ex Monitilora ramsayi)]|nr:response regulator [Candidatus Thiodiazotropha sp. (ex Monitilora ramsayi)]